MDELTRKRYREDFYRERRQRSDDDRDGRQKIERIRGDELPNAEEERIKGERQASVHTHFPCDDGRRWRNDGHLHNRAAKMSSRNGAGDDH
jgi:hypothetical protein